MIDLHTHTLCSDGTDEPIELLKKAEKIGIEVLSITDHNTVEAYEMLEKYDVSKYYSGKLITGVELNTKILGIPIEILGYEIDYKKMGELLKKHYISAEERNKIEAKLIVEKCKENGIKLEEDCLERFNGEKFASKFIQGEISKFEENLSFFKEEEALTDLKVFYRSYMSNPDCPLYVEPSDIVPTFEVASSLIRECGGLVFIPHIFEYQENAHKILNFILENYEIDGIECYYTTFSNEQTEKLVDLCKKKNLYMSGGSDYHGKNKINVNLGVGSGNLNIKEETIEAWKNG